MIFFRQTKWDRLGQVVSVISDDPSSNPAGIQFSVKFVFEINENKQKEAGVGSLKMG